MLGTTAFQTLVKPGYAESQSRQRFKEYLQTIVDTGLLAFALVGTRNDHGIDVVATNLAAAGTLSRLEFDYAEDRHRSGNLHGWLPLLPPPGQQPGDWRALGVPLHDLPGTEYGQLYAIANAPLGRRCLNVGLLRNRARSLERLTFKAALRGSPGLMNAFAADFWNKASELARLSGSLAMPITASRFNVTHSLRGTPALRSQESFEASAFLRHWVAEHLVEDSYCIGTAGSSLVVIHQGHAVHDDESLARVVGGHFAARYTSRNLLALEAFEHVFPDATRFLTRGRYGYMVDLMKSPVTGDVAASTSDGFSARPRQADTR